VEPLEIRGSQVVLHDDGIDSPSESRCGILSVRCSATAAAHSLRGKHLKKATIHAIDGDLGKLYDIYFDDEKWTVRYLVVDTTKIWPVGRRVLISPHALLPGPEPGQALHLNLTKEQIRHSPSINTDRPVSRQQETDLAMHYGWPAMSVGMLPAGIVGPSYTYTGTHYAHTESADQTASTTSDSDPHLRSAREVASYHLESPVGRFGHVEDFEYNLTEARVRALVAEAEGTTVLIPVGDVLEIRWADRTVKVRQLRL
jgi:hypothetical protein